MHKLEMKHSREAPLSSIAAAAPGPETARVQQAQRKALMAKHSEELSKLKKRHADELKKAREKK